MTEAVKVRSSPTIDGGRPARPTKLGRGVPLLATLLLSAAILFGGLNTYIGHAVIGAGCCTFAAAILVLGSPPIRFWDEVALVLALFGAAAAWATAPLSLPLASVGHDALAPDIAGLRLVAMMGYASSFVVGALIANRPEAVVRCLAGLLAFGVVDLVSGVLIRDTDLLDGFEIWRVSRSEVRFLGTFNNANVMGAYCGMLAILALSMVFGVRTRNRAANAPARQLAYGLVMLVALAGCALTASRSAMVCTAIAAVLFLVGSRPTPKASRSGLAISLLAGVVALALVASYSGLLLDRFALLGHAPSGRMLMWQHYGPLVWGSPWFGYGLGAFPVLNAQSLTGPHLANELWRVNSPHNVVLQLLLEGGIGFLLLVGSAAAVIVRNIIRAVRADQFDVTRLGIACALVVPVGCAMVDIALDVPAMIALTLFLSGLATGQSARRTSESRARTSRHRSISD